MNYGFDIDEIEEAITSVFEEEYGPTDRSGSLFIKGQTPEEVRQTILERIEDPDMKKLKYLDLCAYCVSVNGGTMVSIHKETLKKRP